MPYTIELQLNRAAETKFLKFWDILRDEKISDLLYSLNYRPHLTLAMYREIDVDRTIAKLEKFVAGETSIPINFPHITVSTNSIFSQPSENAALRKFHTRFERKLGRSFRPIDLAGSWMPHCSIGMELPADRIGHALDKMLAQWAPISGSVDHIALIKFRPGQTLWRKRLARA